MADMTLYKRDKKAKEPSACRDTKCFKVRFNDRDIEMNRTIKIGREDGNDIVIKDDPQVSRRHAIIEQEGTAFFIKDKDSTNGTYVNNNPIPKGGKMPLKNGDTIRVGKTLLNIL